MLERFQILTETKKKHKNINPHKRYRRGLIDGIERLSKWLFGTLHSGEITETLQQNQQQVEINHESSLSHDLINIYNKLKMT